MWVISNDSFLLIVCFIKEQNKLCFITISYFDIKLKHINIVFVLKLENDY